MAKVERKEINKNDYAYVFYCSGCKGTHYVHTEKPNSKKAKWKFNNDVNKPTFSPSIKIKYGNGELCHSLIKDGYIEYLKDCTHKLAKQTIELMSIEIFDLMIELKNIETIKKANDKSFLTSEQ